MRADPAIGALVSLLADRLTCHRLILPANRPALNTAEDVRPPRAPTLAALERLDLGGSVPHPVMAGSMPNAAFCGLERSPMLAQSMVMRCRRRRTITNSSNEALRVAPGSRGIRLNGH